MGVLDRLRGRPRTEEAAGTPERTDPASPLDLPELPPGPGASQFESDAPTLPEMRGDFMLLPPMRPTFGRPATFGRSLDEFLTTHRPISVTTEPMAHDIEPERLGMISARARRGSKPAPRIPSADLTHRQSPVDFDEDVVEQAPDLTPGPSRKLKASIPPPVRPAPIDLSGQMPSVSQVNQAVRAPSMRFSSSTAPTVQQAPVPAIELEAVREASRMDSSSSSPVLRPRGVGNVPGKPMSAPTSPPLSPPVSPPSALQPSVESARNDGSDSEIDLDSLTAPSAADIPVISSPPRFRGAPPPQAPAAPESASVTTGTRPLLSLPSAPQSIADPTDQDASGDEAPELAHRQPAPSTQPDESSTLEPPATLEPPSTPTGTLLAPGKPRASRALLGGQPSVTTSPPSMFGGPAEVSTGSTGIQRKARSDSSPATPSARSVARPAPAGSAPSTTPSNPSTLTTTSPPLAAPAADLSSSPAPTLDSGSTGVQRKERAGTLPDAGTPSVPDLADSSQPSGETDAPSVESAAPTAIPVPPEVRRAVTEAAGSAPDTALVHMGEHAHTQADALNAEAFTRDGEIFLASDAKLDTPRGRALLAHELTHVVQQQGQSIPMPDEGTDEGMQHEQAAVSVEHALAAPPQASDPVELHHATGAPPSPGAEPANVPQGVQRKARGLNSSIQDDDDRVALPPTPALEPAHASVLQPTLKEQVDLVHAGKAPGVDQGAAAAVGMGGVQQPRPASAARPEAGTSLAVPMSVTTLTPNAITPAPVSQSGGGGSRGQSGAGSDTSEVSRPEPSALEKGIGYFSRMTSAPAAAPQDEESERGDLERQADSLYPLIRSRLRAELVRDLDRRGRLTREWR